MTKRQIQTLVVAATDVQIGDTVVKSGKRNVVREIEIPSRDPKTGSPVGYIRYWSVKIRPISELPADRAHLVIWRRFDRADIVVERPIDG